MSSPNANAYIVSDIASMTEGPGYRWAFAHPVLRFVVPPMEHPRFLMDFALPNTTFRHTGSITLRFSLNDQFLEEVRYAESGPHRYEREIAPGQVRWNGVNLVGIEPSPVWTMPEDGSKLSFVLLRAGFVE